MKTILKYPLDPQTSQSIMMPEGAFPMHVDKCAGIPTVWSLVETEAPLKPVNFYVVYTGEPLQAGQLRYLGTLLAADSAIHVFCDPPPGIRPPSSSPASLGRMPKHGI